MFLGEIRAKQINRVQFCIAKRVDKTNWPTIRSLAAASIGIGIISKDLGSPGQIRTSKSGLISTRA